MSDKIDKIQVLERIKGYYNLKTNVKFASFLGIAPTTLSSWYSRSTFDLDVIYSKCAELSMDWVLTGRGSMLRDSKNPEETTIKDVPNVVPISPAEESIIYKMYKDEKEDWKAEKEKKEAQIDHLQSELRSMEKELATLKATHPQTSPPGIVIEEIREVLGSPRIVKHADTKPHSSTCAPSASSVQPHQENQ